MSILSDTEGTILQSELERFLPYDHILKLARNTGFCQRIRKIHPVIFLQVLVFAPCLHRHATVAEIWRTYLDLTGSDIVYSSFVGRLNDAAACFCKVVLEDCI